MIVIAGSCLHFEKERQKIMEFIGELEWGAHTKSKFECSSTGSAMGWEFFQIYFDPDFIEKLIEVHPGIEKEEGHMIESNLCYGFQNNSRKRRWSIT